MEEIENIAVCCYIDSLLPPLLKHETENSLRRHWDVGWEGGQLSILGFNLGSQVNNSFVDQ